MSFERADKFFKNTVTLTNIDTEPMDEVRYMRNFDPDNTVDQDGDYTTRNRITHTHVAGDGMALVVADTDLSEIDDPEFDGYEDPVHAVNGSDSPIFFYSSDTRARVSTYGFDNIDPYDVNAYDEAPEKGTVIFDDIAINITFDVGTLAAGESETFTYYTSLDNRDISEIVADIANDEVEADDDADNISNEVEDAGPNNGDANGDGIVDSTQPNVTSIPNGVVGGDSYIALELDGDCDTITELALKSEIEVKDDGDFNYPLGLADFAASCSSVGGSSTVKIYFDKQYETSNWTIRKFMNDAYKTVSGYALGTATVGDNTVTTLTYTVVDGGDLDADGIANGVIVDPAGPAVLAASAPNAGIKSRNILFIFAPAMLTTLLFGYALYDRRYVNNADIPQTTK